LWWLDERVVQQPSERHPLCAGRRWQWPNRLIGDCKRRLRQQLVGLVYWFADAVERDQGLLYGSYVAYLNLNGMITSTGLIAGGNIIPATTNTALFKNVDNEHNWMARFRVHRDFYP